MTTKTMRCLASSAGLYVLFLTSAVAQVNDDILEQSPCSDPSKSCIIFPKNDQRNSNAPRSYELVSVNVFEKREGSNFHSIAVAISRTVDGGTVEIYPNPSEEFDHVLSDRIVLNKSVILKTPSGNSADDIEISAQGDGCFYLNATPKHFVQLRGLTIIASDSADTACISASTGTIELDEIILDVSQSRAPAVLMTSGAVIISGTEEDPTIISGSRSDVKTTGMVLGKGSSINLDHVKVEKFAEGLLADSSEITIANSNFIDIGVVIALSDNRRRRRHAPTLSIENSTFDGYFEGITLPGAFRGLVDIRGGSNFMSSQANSVAVELGEEFAGTLNVENDVSFAGNSSSHAIHAGGGKGTINIKAKEISNFDRGILFSKKYLGTFRIEVADNDSIKSTVHIEENSPFCAKDDAAMNELSTKIIISGSKKPRPSRVRDRICSD